MNSEALENLTLFLNARDPNGEVLEDYLKIRKDLEVLDILKRKCLGFMADEDSWLYLKIDKVNMFQDEFEKIKEWLKNEN